jgi:hypothetical protein
MARRKRHVQTTPLTQWLLDYIDEHDTNLTELSLHCGLSAGALRNLVNFPDRKPNIETCIRLSETTGNPATEIMAMAGMDGITISASIHPDRIELIQIFEKLPQQHRLSLLTIARAMNVNNS